MRIAPAPNHFMLTDSDRFAYIWPIHRGKPVCQYPGLPLFRGIFVMLRRFGLVCLFVSIATLPVRAESVRITQDIEARTIMLNGAAIVIDRIQDSENRLEGEFTRTSRPCPPFCITPMTVAPGVVTLGELEVMDFLETRVAAGEGLLLDSRLPEFFAKGTIPGAVNLPFATLDPTNPYRDEILKALGATFTGSEWDFAQARQLAVFCNGPWCNQAPLAIRHLLQAGYPAGKLSYYRGGMQVWLQLGLSTHVPNGG